MHPLGAKGILRTRNHVEGVPKPEIEDLLRTTLAILARDEPGIDVVEQVAQRRQQPIVDMLAKAGKSFSRYRLAEAFLRCSRDHDASDLAEEERTSWIGLVDAINTALR